MTTDFVSLYFASPGGFRLSSVLGGLEEGNPRPPLVPGFVDAAFSVLPGLWLCGCLNAAILHWLYRALTSKRGHKVPSAAKYP